MQRALGGNACTLAYHLQKYATFFTKIWLFKPVNENRSQILKHLPCQGNRAIKMCQAIFFVALFYLFQNAIYSCF